MLKVQLRGTTRDIKWFRKILMRDKRMELLGISDILPSGKNPKYHRLHAEIRKNIPRDKRKE